MAVLTPKTTSVEEIKEYLDNTNKIKLNFGLEISPYEVLTLVAPTGAGKTTLTINLVANLNKVLYFALEETRATMGKRIVESQGEEYLSHFEIIDQSDFSDSYDDCEDIIETINNLVPTGKYDAVVIDHLTCIRTFNCDRHRRTAVNRMKQITTNNRIPLIIINQYLSNAIKNADRELYAGGRDTLNLATLSLILLKNNIEYDDISDNEYYFYGIDKDAIEDGDDIVFSGIDSKHNLNFRSNNLRLLKRGVKNRFGNSFNNVLLDFDIKSNRYCVFDKDKVYSKEQKYAIVVWNSIVANIEGIEYHFDETSDTCYKIDTTGKNYIFNCFLTYGSKSKEEKKHIIDSLIKLFNYGFKNYNIRQIDNILYGIKQDIINLTKNYLDDKDVIKLLDVIQKNS